MSRSEREPNYQLRRGITAWAIERLWPYEVVEHDHNNAIEQIQKFADEGYNFIFAHGHICMPDPYIASAFATNVSPEIAEGEIISPIAWHQRQFARLAEWNGATVYRIVTHNTVAKKKNFQKPPLKERMHLFLDKRLIPSLRGEDNAQTYAEYQKARQGEELQLNNGYRKYAVGSGQALRESKGTTTVFVAPHGGRTSTPKGPAGPAVETIARFAQKSRPKDDPPIGSETLRIERPLAEKTEQDQKEKIAVVLVGVSIRGVKKYEEGKTDGFNLLKKIVLEVDVLTLDEIQDQARLRGISLDEEITNRINNLSYKTYLKPKQLREEQSKPTSH